ncbi:hypothetical protein [Dysgonomonas macrotermitis]|uniref:Prophage endopeptidase tail n=1 Tax=Dysgonomonas macrotermitis TaxID=1346286 RepID=A0A1M5ITD2_9BACT|nr:hypothetical protein [Dysgonomonas macrotermitis]SHG31557.1 hypothetical protein SAMN05444362_12111 [Dysgonomonas macrotermitis]
MQLYNPNTTPLIDIEVSDESYAYNSIMNRDDLSLYFNLTQYIDMPIDMYCVFQNMMYYLVSENNFKKSGNRNYEYTLVLEAPVAYMKKTKFKFITLNKEPDGSIELNAPPKIKYSLRGTPSDFLDMIIDCMNYNDRNRGWTKGECIDGVEMTIDINDMFCYEFLGDVADRYKTEFNVEGKTVHLKKVERKDFPPIPLAYGEGNGILYGLERKIYKTPISRVWIESSDRNIDFASYGNDTLRLPKSRTIVYEGIEYVTDSTGSYIERAVPLRDVAVPPEETLDVTEIYPSHEGTITGVEEIDDSKGLWAFIDADNVIDYNQLAIAGETAAIIFQTGELAGSEKEFTFAYDHTTKRFRIQPISENGLVYPQGTIIPAVGDKYAVFHIKLPQEYIDEAEEKALNEVVAYLYENEQPQYTYSVTLDQKYAKENWGVIGDRLNIGYFIHLTDPHFLPEGADIRITATTRFVNKPRMPKIELSNSVTRTSFNTSVVNKVENNEQTVDRKQQEVIRFAKRSWAQSMELLNAMRDPSGSFVEQLLSSVSIHSMMALFGDETLQYQFVAADWLTVQTPAFAFDPETKKFLLPASNVKHMTLDIDTMQPNRQPDQYKYWSVTQYLTDVLTETDQGYYVYMKCSKSFDETDGLMIGTGEFFISSEGIGLYDIDGYYCLWVGYLSSEFEGDRSFRTVYGYTEILPGQMTVDNIYSSDGNSWWRLLDNQFKVPGLDWNVTEENTLTLANAVIRETLKVFGEALFAGWIIDNDKFSSIAQNTDGTPKILLDGTNGIFRVKKLWDSPELQGQETIEIDPGSYGIYAYNTNNNSRLSANGLNVSSRGSYVSSAVDGNTYLSSVSALGRGAINTGENYKGTIGVYGTASNVNASDVTPAYGGWFDKLRVNGLILKVKQISGTTDQNTELLTTDTYIFSDSTVQQTVTLPADAYIGLKLELKQWMSGSIRLQPPTGHKLYQNSTESTYIDIVEGETATVVCVDDRLVDDVKVKVWLLSKYKY